jgi:hypothetical protein
LSLYLFSNNPPEGWHKACKEAGRLFHTPGWQHLLETSFGCRTVYAWDEIRGGGAAFSIFNAGPFRVAYLGFPVGSFLGQSGSYAGLLQSWRSQTAISLPACVRVPVSSLDPDPGLKLPAARTPETAIENLSAWSLQSTSSNIRRDLKKAGRAALECGNADSDKDAAAVFDLYEATIQRNRGSMRYTRAYFTSLVRLSRSLDNLRVRVARKNGKIVAFNASALDGSRGYYLHGGMDVAARNDRPGAPLMFEAIRWAQQSGGQSFNFLSSPVGQESLVRYKEKWGGTTRDHFTYTQKLGASYPLFRLAEWLHRSLGRR